MARWFWGFWAGWAGAAPFGWPAGLVVLRAVGLVLGTTLVLRYGVHRDGASRQPVGWHTRPGAPYTFVVVVCNRQGLAMTDLVTLMPAMH
jgi:hypothetical protein